jgi:hypothetical protein
MKSREALKETVNAFVQEQFAQLSEIYNFSDREANLI